MPPISRLEVAQVQGQRAEAVPFGIVAVLPFSPVRWLYRVRQLVRNNSNVRNRLTFFTPSFQGRVSLSLNFSMKICIYNFFFIKSDEHVQFKIFTKAYR